MATKAPISVGDTPRDCAMAGAMAGTVSTAMDTKAWIASVVASVVQAPVRRWVMRSWYGLSQNLAARGQPCCGMNALARQESGQRLDPAHLQSTFTPGSYVTRCSS